MVHSILGDRTSAKSKLGTEYLRARIVGAMNEVLNTSATWIGRGRCPELAGPDSTIGRGTFRRYLSEQLSPNGGRPRRLVCRCCLLENGLANGNNHPASLASLRASHPCNSRRRLVLFLTLFSSQVLGGCCCVTLQHWLD